MVGITAAVAQAAPEAPEGNRPAFRVGIMVAIAVAVSVCVTFAALALAAQVLDADRQSDAITGKYTECLTAAGILQTASDSLTMQARMNVATGRMQYLDAYLKEYLEEDNRGKASRELEDNLSDDEALSALEEARTLSDDLAKRELRAMRLAAEARGKDLSDLPEAIVDAPLMPDDADLEAPEKLERAELLVFGGEYERRKAAIDQKIETGTSKMLDTISAAQAASDERLGSLLTEFQVTIGLLLFIILFAAITTYRGILRPISAYVARIREGKLLVPMGAAELRYLADAYNDIYEENRARTAHLQEAAERDPLTKLGNRAAYEAFLSDCGSDIAMIVADVDLFKEINDSLGHDVGDDVLRKVATAIEGAFRSDDFCCRIGGDEFAVIMVGVRPDMRGAVVERIEGVRKALRDTEDGLPATTLSIGIAFGDDHTSTAEAFRAADQALYSVKGRGRDGYAFSGEGDGGE